ncbi:MAG: ACT domain-containing protein [Lachnospiraceae bacterium]|nr:ACT domain-containing protein [Lachnospiraceae bacterium]MBP3504898.1 ACT domain-containing protein [Lachnospiraceae bacterium]
MTVKQISIFVENKIGNLAEVTKVLSDAGVSLHAISLADTKDFGVLRVIVDDSYLAATTLKEQGYIFSITKVLAVAINDEPGGLYRILTLLEESKINLEYLYDINTRKSDYAYLIFKVGNVEEAIEVLTKNKVRLLCQEDL